MIIASPATKHRIDCEWLQWSQSRKLVNAFAAADKEMRFVGGAVRDSLLGRTVQEVDAATVALPEQTVAILEQEGIKAIPIGIKHGTITALVDDRAFEITTLRRDIICDGRHAQVEFGTSWEEDAKRRDFTMNALFCDHAGEIYDYVGGIEDALSGRVRFIGDAKKRITEDALRILRFFRFFAAYGKVPADEEALAACRELAALTDNLSGERIRSEMLKLLAATNASSALELMRKTTVLEHVLDISHITTAFVALPRIWAQLIPQSRRTADGGLALALLLRGDADAKATAKRENSLQHVCHRWKLSRKMSGRLRILLTEPALPADSDDRDIKRHIRRMGKDLFSDLVLISAAENNAENNSGSDERYLPYKNMLKLAEDWQPPVFPINGNDLKVVGVPAGAQMGKMLKALEEYWESRDYQPDKAELLRRAKNDA